jgi:hypothetical protein
MRSNLTSLQGFLIASRRPAVVFSAARPERYGDTEDRFLILRDSLLAFCPEVLLLYPDNTRKQSFLRKKNTVSDSWLTRFWPPEQVFHPNYGMDGLSAGAMS